MSARGAGSLLAAAVVLLACGDDAPRPALPDAPIAPDAPPQFPACAEFMASAGVTVPAHVTGVIAGAELASPLACATIDAPFGVETAGNDAVVRIDGLVAGTEYVVKLAADADLGFYVATGCGTATGPSADQCALFVDASNSDELGTFVAAGPTAFVVVDHWSTSAPDDPSFTVDVYEHACDQSFTCGLASPVCLDYRCVECASGFDCTTGEASRCDASTNRCVAGTDQCTTDDAMEPANDGPAGAPLLVPDGTGVAAVAGSICSRPSTEADFFAFDVASPAEIWDLRLAWATARDLDLEVFDATGRSFGFSYWENAERVRLTHLPTGRYYVRVREFASSTNAAAQDYTLAATRTSGAVCAGAADCAVEYRNQLFRGDCVAGACVSLEGNGGTPEGGRCDSESDCASELHCPSFFFVADGDTRETCNRECTSDVQCDEGFVCTTYFPTNFCVPKCTTTEQCPTAIFNRPSSGPWVRFACEVSSGRCLP